jgi:hypothetical protein
MPDGAESLLGQQLSAAVQIPYKNIEVAQNAGKMFLNAFYTAAQVNKQRQQLENQLFKTQLDMSFREQKHADDIKQMQWMNAYRTAEESRRTDLANSLIQDRADDNKRQFDQFNQKLSDKEKESSRIGQYRARLTSISAEEQPYTQAWWNKVSVAQNEFADLGKPGDAAFKDFETNARGAVNSAHRAADLMAKNFDRTIAMTGSSVVRNDFLQPNAAWLNGTDQAGNPTRYLAKIKEVDPATKSFSYRVLNAKQKAEKEKQGVKLRYDSLDSNTYNSLREMHNEMLNVGGTDISKKPAWIDPPVETTRNVGQRKAVFDSNTKQFIRWADE